MPSPASLLVDASEIERERVVHQICGPLSVPVDVVQQPAQAGAYIVGIEVGGQAALDLAEAAADPATLPKQRLFAGCEPRCRGRVLVRFEGLAEVSYARLDDSAPKGAATRSANRLL